MKPNRVGKFQLKVTRPIAAHRLETILAPSKTTKRKLTCLTRSLGCSSATMEVKLRHRFKVAKN